MPPNSDPDPPVLPRYVGKLAPGGGDEGGGVPHAARPVDALQQGVDVPGRLLQLLDGQPQVLLHLRLLLQVLAVLGEHSAHTQHSDLRIIHIHLLIWNVILYLT